MTTTADVPGRYHVGLDGIGLMLDEAGDGPALIHQSLRAQREQGGGANENIGERTINPEGFWRRSRDSWSHGAGQTYGDRSESDPQRFRSSRRVDVFSSSHQATLVKALDVGVAIDSTPDQMLVPIADRVYFLDGDVAKFVSDPLTTPWSPTTITGLGGVDALSLCAIGDTIFIGTTGGIYSTTSSSSAASIFTTTVTSLAAWEAKGRLMVLASSGVFYNVTAAGALPTALITFPSGSGVVGVAGVGNFIYIAVTGANSPSVIYKTTIKPDGTALDVPTIAGEFPPGEVLAVSTRNAIFGANGYLFVYTNRGVRMGALDDNGNITFGSEVPSSFTNSAAFTAQGRFVWFALATPNAEHLVGKLDMTVTTLPLTPAYAYDVEPADGGVVNAMTTYSGRRIVATSSNIYVESADIYEDDGYIDSGLLALDLADNKTAVAIDVEGAYPSTTTITEALSIDRGSSFTTVGSFSSAAQDEDAISGVAASRQFELRTTLTANVAADETPTMYRHTLKVEPGVSQGNYIVVRVRLFENEIGFGGNRQSRAAPATALAALEALQASRAVVVFQEGSTSWNVTVRDIESETVTPCEPPLDGDWNRVATLRLKSISAA